MNDALLEIDGVSKAFGGLHVIRDVRFSIAAGARVALIGPNGAGKTTLFNLISGVYVPDRGRIRLGDADLTRLAPWRRAALGLARSFQNIRLMPHLTTLENVMLAQHQRARALRDRCFPLGLVRRNRWADEARSALAQARLDAYADRLAENLPYGVQKRIELVRASLAGARLVLLDEPAAGLNPVETDELLALVEALAAGGTTLVVVEHDMPFVRRFAERVIVLNFGETIADGTLAEVSRDPRVLEAYLGRAAGTDDAA